MNKTVIITGSNRGIGKQLVKTFAENNYDIWACARKQSNEFEDTLKNIADNNNVTITPIYFDLSDEAQTKEGIKSILQEKRNHMAVCLQ